MEVKEIVEGIFRFLIPVALFLAIARLLRNARKKRAGKISEHSENRDEKKKNIARPRENFLADILIFGPLLGTIGILIWQASIWSRTGRWVPMPASKLLWSILPADSDSASALMDWLLNPQSWISLSKIASWTLEQPLALFLVILCALGAIFYE